MSGLYRRLLATAPRRGHMAAESAAKAALAGVVEPLTGRPLASIGALRGLRADEESGSIRVDVDMMVPGHPMLPAIKASCEAALREQLPWVREVAFTDLSLPASPKGINGGQTALANVQHCIAVSSCKGGVGKTTVAVNLAVTLAQRGLRVGLLDADVYGPSIPLLVPAEDNIVKRSESRTGSVLPLRAAGLPNLCMLSFGHVSPSSGAPGSGGTEAAIMRGPIASRVITQLVAATDWGSLDYLIVDMPPGTGDIQITLTQAMAFSGAVVVTTPHALAAADCAKGVAAFEQLQVPVLALVENMAFFDCDAGKRYYPFGRGARGALLHALQVLHSTGEESDKVTKNKNKQNGIQQAKVVRREKLTRHIEAAGWHQLPLSADISAGAQVWAGPGSASASASARGEGRNEEEETEATSTLQETETETEAEVPSSSPVSMRSPDSIAAGVYSNLADTVVSEIFKGQLRAELVPSLAYSSERGLLLRYFGATSVREFAVPVWELRSRDPATGHRTAAHSAATASELQAKFADVEPSTFDAKGNYGVSVVWSDGHYADIFPFEVLRAVAEEINSIGED